MTSFLRRLAFLDEPRRAEAHCIKADAVLRIAACNQQQDVSASSGWYTEVLGMHLWRFGVAVACWSRSARLLYVEPG